MPEKIHMGAINVVSKINKIEIPSTPRWKLIKPSIQLISSTNWNSGVETSKMYQRNNERKKFTREEKIATYFEFFITIFLSPFITKINKAPMSGINMIAESIGKVI